MEVEVDESKEKFTDFYWIVRRSLKVYEGDEACIDSGRRGDNCYEASRKRKIGSNRSSGGSNKGIVKYELSLYIDQIEEEDLEERIFLVKDYREVSVLLCEHFSFQKWPFLKMQILYPKYKDFFIPPSNCCL